MFILICLKGKDTDRHTLTKWESFHHWFTLQQSGLSHDKARIYSDQVFHMNEWQGSRFELSSSACLSIPLHPAPQYISRKLDRKHGSWELNKNCDVGFGYPKKWLNKNLSLHFHLFIHCVWEANRRKLEINHGPALFSKMFATALQEAETGSRATIQQNTHIYMGVSISILNAIPKWFPKLLWVWWVGIAS